MPYRLLADAVVVLHFIWIMVLLGGIWFSLKYKRYRPIHLTVTLTTIVSQLIWLGCPLVALEETLRRQYDPTRKYAGSFTVYYLHHYFGVEVPPLAIIASLGIIAIIAIFTISIPSTEKNAGRRI